MPRFSLAGLQGVGLVADGPTVAAEGDTSNSAVTAPVAFAPRGVGRGSLEALA